MTAQPCPVVLSLDGINDLSPVELSSFAQNQSSITLHLSNGVNPEQTRRVSLKPNKELFGSDLPLHLSSSHNYICHFIGSSNHGESVALSTCSPDSITGVVQIGERHFALHVEDGFFVLIPQNGEGCEWARVRSKRAGVSLGSATPEYYKDYLDGKTRFVELAFIADHSIYVKYGKNEQKVHDRLHAIANGVNSIFYPLNIRVTLVWADIWTDDDKIKVTEESDKTLLEFLGYRRSIMRDSPNDNAQLLTDVKFQNLVIGKAYKGTMCSYDYSGGVIMDHHSSAAAVASTSAHEMGHSFGMEHDPEDCQCPDRICIMAASNGGYSTLSHWSSCSLEYLQASMSRKMDYCLHNVPKKAFGGAKCGNGIVEEGEDCDCGNTIVCPNKCCVASKCKLAKDAICASGDCCDINTCLPKKKAAICRAPISSCDLPEYCDGETGECPADFFVQNGQKCPDDSKDYCYEGICGSRDQQCQVIWGPTGINSGDACYWTNQQGNIFGNCGHIHSNDSYTKCSAENIKCGRLHCQPQTDKPVFGDPSTVRTAYTHARMKEGGDMVCRIVQTTYTGGRNKRDPGMVPDGASCGKNRICINSKCSDNSEVLRVAPKCDPSNCFNKGICNNVGNCHCQYGYGGTGCDLPGYGGSVNSGPATDQAFNAILWLAVVIGCILALFAILTYYRHKRVKKFLPAEIWELAKEKLNIQAMLVPVRKAPPPPGGSGGRRGTDDLNHAWGDAPPAVRVGARPVVPPAIVHLPAFNQHGHQHLEPQQQQSPIANVTHNRRDLSYPITPSEARPLNPIGWMPGDSSSSDETPSAELPPPPVPAHRHLPNPPAKPPVVRPSGPPPPIKQKPKIPQKPPVTVTANPVTNVDVKALAAKFNANNS